MSAEEILAAVRRLPEAERRKLVAQIENEFFVSDLEPTAEQIAEFERRGDKLARNPQGGIPWETVRDELPNRSKAEPQPECPMAVAPFLSAAQGLPFEERVELAHRLWDEFMDGFQDWKAPPMPEGDFAWKTLKAEIDAKLSRPDRLELAQQLWGNIVDEGFEPELTPKQAAELDRRLADFEKNPQEGIPWEQVREEMRQRFGWK